MTSILAIIFLTLVAAIVYFIYTGYNSVFKLGTLGWVIFFFLIVVVVTAGI